MLNCIPQSSQSRILDILDNSINGCLQNQILKTSIDGIISLFMITCITFSSKHLFVWKKSCLNKHNNETNCLQMQTDNIISKYCSLIKK